MDDLLEEFIAEARDMLQALSSEIVAWENDPADSERLGAIFRFVHTIKGNCGFFDLPQLEKLSHAAEDVLADCRAGRRQPDQALVTAVLAVIDRIEERVDALVEGDEVAVEQDEHLMSALQQTGSDQAPDTPAPVPAEEPKASGKDESESAARTANQRSIRVPLDLLESIMRGVSDITLARNDLQRHVDDEGLQATLGAPFSRLSSSLEELSVAIFRIRMQRIEALFAGFPRLVRDLSHDLGKSVQCTIDDGDVEIDRELIEVVRDPLVHVLRNAVDHGIETPEQRRAADKPETGSLKITARQTGNHIRVGIVDDGKGIDSDALVARAISEGRLDAEQAAALSSRERNQLICEPGWSTAEKITSISGRGVGMDLVKANIERIGGALMIDSTYGAGTRIMLDIPLTLSVVPSLIMTAGGQTFALPRSYVDEIVQKSDEKAKCAKVGGRMFLELRGQQIPCMQLTELLGMPENEPGPESMVVLLKLVGGDLCGLVVDTVEGHEELVARPLAPILSENGPYTGVTQLSDGQPVPMLDVAALARAAGVIGDLIQSRVSTGESEATAEEKTLASAMLFESFDGAEKAIEMESLVRIERVEASTVRQGKDGVAQVALDGRVVPLVGLSGDPTEDRIGIFRIGEGKGQIAHAFAAMIDLVQFDPSLVVDEGDSDSRIAMIEGRPVQLLDCDKLLAEASGQMVEGS